jgi:Putative bacterial sensory transduction regulator
MADEIASEEQLAAIEARISAWLDDQLATNPVIAAVDRDVAARRWYIRMRGEEKDTFTLWLTVGQRTLQFETYVMPAPEENEAVFYEHVLRRNRAFNGMAFCVGEEDAIFLTGQLPIAAVDEGEFDRILGETYAYVERCFRPAMRIGYASRFGG